MIIGVTHDQDGRVVQRLSVSTKVSIGLPPNGDRNHPTKLDHFVFLLKKKSANRVGWEVDPELTEHYGDKCRELHIMLIDDDVDGHGTEVLGRRHLGYPAHNGVCGWAWPAPLEHVKPQRSALRQPAVRRGAP